jgi:glutathione synthase/RimK-type ligase-like ATP-grasp enzyme
MKNKQIIILTEKNDFFGQTRKPWVSIDTKLFLETFKKKGFDIQKLTFDNVANQASEISNCIIIYTFSQKIFVRQYIKDVIFILEKKNLVIPSYELLKCHENKGFQELLKKYIGINSLQAYYFDDFDLLKTYQLNYPLVLKSITGSNGKDVYLIKDEKRLHVCLKKYFITVSLFHRIDIFRRTYLRKAKKYPEYPTYSNKKDVQEYKEYTTHCQPFILQEFVPNLSFDYRVLILNDKFYVTKRHVREDDFRASGAKKFDFNFEPDPNLLQFAKTMFDFFKQPILSFDICEKEGTFYLLEFQALHFGINVFVKSKGYYSLAENTINFHPRINSFEVELAEAFIKHIEMLA